MVLVVCRIDRDIAGIYVVGNIGWIDYFFCFFVFFLIIRRPPRSTQSRSSAASDVYKRQALSCSKSYIYWKRFIETGEVDFQSVRTEIAESWRRCLAKGLDPKAAKRPIPLSPEEILGRRKSYSLSLIHISEPTRLLSISYAVFCLKKKNKLIKKELIKLLTNNSLNTLNREYNTE